MAHQVPLRIPGETTNFAKPLGMFVELLEKIAGVFPNGNLVRGHQSSGHGSILPDAQHRTANRVSGEIDGQVNPHHLADSEAKGFRPPRKQFIDERLCCGNADETESCRTHC